MAAHDLKDHLRLGNVPLEFLQILRRSPRSLRFIKNDQPVGWRASISIAVSNKSMYFPDSCAYSTRCALLPEADAAFQRLLNNGDKRSITRKEGSLLDVKIKL